MPDYFKVEVHSTEVDDFKGVGKTSGKPFHIRNQKGYIFVDPDSPYPAECKIPLDTDQVAFPKGTYKYFPKYEVDRNGAFKINNFQMNLVACADSKPADLKKVG